MIPGRLVLPPLRWRADTEFSHEERAIVDALSFGAGGFILFGGTVESVRTLTTRLRRDAGRPLLIASDLERGAGQQVAGLDELPPPGALATLGDVAVIDGAGALTATQALGVGINWVLAPVADLDAEPANPIVQTRSFGEDAGTAAACVAAWVHGCEGAGAMACAKHFPGHGRTRTDSHAGVPVVDADEETLWRRDMLPFGAAIEMGAGSVMTAHVAYPALDPTGLPATFSSTILGILRDKLGFGGLIVTDALMMAGARLPGGAGEAALTALRAGVDLLLYPDDPAAMVRAVEGAVQEDPAFARRVEQCLARYDLTVRSLDVPMPAEMPEPAGSALAIGDWLLDGPLHRGEPPRLVPPLELVVVDDDTGGPYAASPADYTERLLRARGVPLGAGGSRVVLALAEPRAWKGRAGFSPASRERLAGAADADLVVLFGHVRLAAELPRGVPVLLAWHRQRLMQEAVGRWLAGRLAP